MQLNNLAEVRDFDIEECINHLEMLHKDSKGYITISSKDPNYKQWHYKSEDIIDNAEDILNRLSWFITHNICLLVCKYSATYEYGIRQPINKAVLTTLLQSMLNEHKNIAEISNNKRKNSGRNRMAFPDGWDKLYEKWKNHTISSKEFMEQSGLKKATFYNMLTEYRTMLEEQNDYLKKYTQTN